MMTSAKDLVHFAGTFFDLSKAKPKVVVVLSLFAGHGSPASSGHRCCLTCAQFLTVRLLWHHVWYV